MRTRIAVVGTLLGASMAGAMACGGTSGGTTVPGYTITISNLSYSPLNLDVPPGRTVNVVNRDGMPHSVTSEAASGAYVPGAVAGVSFDTGNFQGSTPATFDIPATAAEGTVIPYYCKTHLGTMNTPNGTITVRAAATPNQQGGGGGMGY